MVGFQFDKSAAGSIKLGQTPLRSQNLISTRLLKSCDVDILADGSLDLPNDVLKELDLVVCSIHSKFNLIPVKQTERIVRAMHNPHFHIFGHPTGRLIGRRAPSEFDIERVLKVARERRLHD